MKALRCAALLGVSVLACAKRPDAEGSMPPQTTAAPEAGADEDDMKKLEAKDVPTGASAGMSPVAQSAPATLEELTAALDDYEADLRTEGVRLKTYRKDQENQAPHTKRTPPTKPAAAAGTKKDDPQVRICAIRTSVCEIRSRICTLATEHEDEPRYAAACKRATNDCKRASEACNDGG